MNYTIFRPMKSPPSSSTASAIYTTIAHMRHAVATRFLDLPRQFIPWRREVLTPDGKLSTVDAFMLRRDARVTSQVPVTCHPPFWSEFASLLGILCPSKVLCAASMLQRGWSVAHRTVARLARRAFASGEHSADSEDAALRAAAAGAAACASGADDAAVVSAMKKATPLRGRARPCD